MDRPGSKHKNDWGLFASPFLSLAELDPDSKSDSLVVVYLFAHKPNLSLMCFLLPSFDCFSSPTSEPLTLLMPIEAFSLLHLNFCVLHLSLAN